MERWQKPEVEHPCGSAVAYPSRSSLDFNTPLRSTRGDATAAPSPFYKLSAELSRESLRIPGAVPFMWEQSPGCRKFTAASTLSTTSPHSITMQPLAGSFVPESISTTAADPAKPNLATLFRQPSLKCVVLGMPATADSWPVAPISSAIPQISPPPAADHPRSSSARYSVMQRNMPLGPSFNNASLHDNGDDDDTVSEEDISDALTATAGEGLSMDDSLVLSGAFRPASTPSEARDFIMDRFLPAAHTIACESPQTPSRRFLPPVGVGAAPASPATPARSNGSFRDHAAACAAASRPSPLRYASASSTPASNAMQLQPRGQLCAGSFQGEGEEEEEEEEDVEEEAPFTPKACGIFPFHINLSFHNRHTPRASPSPKHQHNKQQHQKKSSKSMKCPGTPTRIMDILRDNHSSSHDDESPMHRLRSKQSEAEREHTKIAVLERAGLMYASNDPRIKPPFESYYRGSPNLHQLLTAQQAPSEVYSEEASEYGSYQDAPSRFQSPSPAALHLNARASRAFNMPSPLVNSGAQRSRSFAGLQDDYPSSSAVIRTTEQNLLNSSFYYYNMQTSMNKPHYQAPSTYHTPLSSHVSASYDKGSYHDTTNIKPLEKANYHGIPTTTEQWDAHSPSNLLAQKTHIINNALYEHEVQETNRIFNANSPSMFTTISEHVATYSRNCTRLNPGTALKQAGDGGGHGYGESNINGDHYVSKGDQCVSKGDYNLSNGDHHMSIGDYHLSSGYHHMVNGDLHGDKGDHRVSNGNHNVSNGNHYEGNGSHQGDHYVSNNNHYASKDDLHYVIHGDNHVSKGVQYVINGDNHGDNQVINGDNHVINGVQYVSNGNNHVSNGDMYVSNIDLHGKIISSFPSKSLLSPPLPKSPTHSWLDRAMPLVASTNKSLVASSRLSHMHKATPADDYVASPVSMSKMRKHAPPSSAEASKWEALVKGSHLQPGHLRFSEELYHQSQSVMKVGAS